MHQYPTTELVRFPSIFIFAEALSSFTCGTYSKGASMSEDSESGIERGDRSVIERSLTGDPKDSELLIE
jgi:hypothetical protein